MRQRSTRPILGDTPPVPTMRRYALVALLLVIAAPLALAQPASHPFFPLAEGNTWIWDVYTAELHLEAVVLGWEGAGEAAHWRVRVTTRPFSGEPGEESLCAVRIAEADGEDSGLVQPLAGDYCGVLQLSVASGQPIAPLPSNGSPENVWVSGQEHAMMTATTSAEGTIDYIDVEGRWKLGQGVGLVEWVWTAHSDEHPGLRLVYANVGGTTFGVHPDAFFATYDPTAYMPLAQGNRWVYRYACIGYGVSCFSLVPVLFEYEVTATGPEEGHATLRRRVYLENGAGPLPNSTLTCTAVASPLGRVTLSGDWRCPFGSDADTPPAPWSFRMIGASHWASVPIGSSSHTFLAHTFRRFRLRYSQYDEGARTELTGAYGVGVVAYSHVRWIPGTGTYAQWEYSLRYAEVGGVAYGQNPVSAGDAPAGVAALGASVHPNPARGSALLQVTSGAPGELTVEVYDALGRVRLREPLAPGTETHALDVSALAAGSYVAVVRGADGERAVARFAVVR